MTEATISFRIDDDKKAALDALAAEMERDRSFVLNQAIEAYLEVRSWQRTHIEEGLARPMPTTSPPTRKSGRPAPNGNAERIGSDCAANR